MRPASRQSGARSPSSRCCDHVRREQLRLPDFRDRRDHREQEQADPEGEEPDAPAGDGLPSPCEGAGADGVGDRDRDDRDELQGIECPARQHEGSSTFLTVRSARGPGAPDLRGGGRLDREGRRGRRASPRGRRVDRGARIRSIRRAVPARRRAAARRLDGLGRDEARSSRASAGRCAHAGSTSQRTASTTSIDERRRSVVPPRLRRGEPDRPRAGGGARRGRRRGLSRRRVRAPRRRDRRASGHLPRRGARLRGHLRGPRGARPLLDGSGIVEGDSSSAFPRRAFTRTGSHSSGAYSRTRTTRAPICLRRRGSISRTSARCASGRRTGFAHVTGGGIEGTSTACPERAAGRDRLGRVARPPVFGGSRATSRRTSSGACSTWGSGISRSCRIRERRS